MDEADGNGRGGALNGVARCVLVTTRNVHDSSADGTRAAVDITNEKLKKADHRNRRGRRTVLIRGLK